MADSKDVAAETNTQEEEKTEQPPPKNVVIIEEGDVLLACRDADKHGRLLVSSIVLKHTSLVFKAMLGPNFAEGQTTRSSLHPQEVQCPEDGWHAMVLLCKLLHNSRQSLNVALPPAAFIERLAEAAVLADKYGCIDAVSMQAQSVFAKFGDRLISDRQPAAVLRDLATAAYMLKRSNYFYIFTKRLVLDHNQPYSALLPTGSKQMEDPLGAIFLMKLEDQRSAARLKVGEAIPEFGVYNCNVPGCDKSFQSRSFMTAFKDAVNFNTDWPPTFSYLSLRVVLRKIENTGDVVATPMVPCQHTPAQRAGVPYQVVIPAIQFTQFARQINREMAGMCLKCVKVGSFGTGPCKVESHWKPTAGWEDELSRS